MRRVHEATLLVGIASLAAVVSLHALPLPRAPYLYFALIAVPFIVSLVCAMWFTLQPRSAALPSRSVFTYFIAALGFAFILVGGVNDLWLPLSYPQRFVLFLSTICLLFTVPWVATDFHVLHRSPLAFDAALAPFLALGLYLITASHFDIYLFWASEFWLVLGFPAFVITYFVMRRALRRGLSTCLPLSISTAVLYLILATLRGA